MLTNVFRESMKSVLTFALFVLTSVSLYSQTIDIPFYGDYADPSIVRVGEDFYMTHTSHNYYPGLLIWHSKDLKQWKPVKRTLYTDVGTVWAPELVYYKKKYYLYFPTDKGGNYVITADSPQGKWSEPIKLNVAGIDPGHIVGKDGKRYLYVNAGRMVELSNDGLNALTSEKQVYEGWPHPKDWVVECFCLESPKLLYKDNYFYMVSAQGGTSGPSTGHMAVVARSKNVDGPWENSPYNPLVHTDSAAEPWISKGHGTLFDDSQGNWYLVYHAYESGNRPMGRATLIEPVEWTSDGWPRLKMVKPALKEQYVIHPNTQLESDSFDSEELHWQWSFWGLDGMNDYSISDGSLMLKGTEKKLKALTAIASNADYEMTVELETKGDIETGLALMVNENYYVGIALKDGTLQGLSHGKAAWEKIEAKECRYLRLRVEKYTVGVSYSADGKDWKTYPHGFDASGYHTNMLGGFLSLKPSILCKGSGSISVKNVKFRYD
jgi:xylan 1,4-beta-xylosidase